VPVAALHVGDHDAKRLAAAVCTFLTGEDQRRENDELIQSSQQQSPQNSTQEHLPPSPDQYEQTCRSGDGDQDLQAGKVGHANPPQVGRDQRQNADREKDERDEGEPDSQQLSVIIFLFNAWRE
jgi:hypothetical protein